MKKINVLILGLLLAPWSFSYAQDEAPEIEFSADRPGASTGTDITPKFKLMWETGVGYEKNRIEGEVERNFTLNTSLFRLGLTDNMELRLQVDAQYTKSDAEKFGGFCPLVLGTKVKFFDGYKAAPKIGMLCNLTIPCGKEEYRPQHLSPQLYLLFDNPVNDWFSIGYNVGAEWDGETPRPNIFAALCLGFSFADRWGAFIENYDYFSRDQKAVWMTEFGVSCQVHPYVQLDLAADLNLGELGKYYAMSLGVAWMINHPRNKSK